MILLDTNYLINALIKDTEEAKKMVSWYSEDLELCTSSIVWFEFACGPVSDEGIDIIKSFLRDRILPFTGDQAAEASRLFNAVGRQRRLRVDSMIAAAAILSNASLATGNRADFSAFSPLGLRLEE